MNYSFDEKPKKLALRLKKCCNEDGKERRSNSATIIYNIGLLHYQQTCNRSDQAETFKPNQDVCDQPDRTEICLIKSVGLLNSALTRPLHDSQQRTKIEKHLASICKHILKKANAHNRSADLIEKAKQIKHQIERLRKETNDKLKTMRDDLKKIEFVQDCQMYTIIAVKEIQEHITAKYKEIMHGICQYCLEILGPAPCPFAVVGMGSLARKEVTPYSDFEHIILLGMHANWKDSLQYFRWYSVIFHTIILNLQETIIHRLNIKYLNDPATELGDWFYDTSTCGISFDSMMPYASKIPLGRTQPTKDKPWTTELIRPVEEMLEYLRSEESLKNGYHLNDILMDTCFIFGNQSLHEEFERGKQAFKNSKTNEELVSELKQQVQEDLDKFAPKTMLVNTKSKQILNIKEAFYRSSALFIAAWGKIKGAKSSSCIDIIDELAENVSAEAKQKLLFAVTTACQIRLSFYMKKESQHDRTEYSELEFEASHFSDVSFNDSCDSEQADYMTYLLRQLILPEYDLDESDVSDEFDSMGDYFEPYRKENPTVFDDISKLVGRSTIISYFQITYCLQQEITNLLQIKRSHSYSNQFVLNFAICFALKENALLFKLIRVYQLFEKYNKFSGKQFLFSIKFDECLLHKLECWITFALSFSSKKHKTHYYKGVTLFWLKELAEVEFLENHCYDDANMLFNYCFEILRHSLHSGEMDKILRIVKQLDRNFNLIKLIEDLHLKISVCLIELNHNIDVVRLHLRTTRHYDLYPPP